MSVDKVDNQTIECMVCASCTFKGEKRQEEWEIGGDSGEAERVMRERVEEERNGIVEKFREKKLQTKQQNQCTDDDSRKDLCTKC